MSWLASKGTAPVVEPVLDECHSWFKILPQAGSVEHFASKVGEKTATFVVKCFRTHLPDSACRLTDQEIFGVLLRFIRDGDVSAVVRLHDGKPQVRFCFEPTTHQEQST